MCEKVLLVEDEEPNLRILAKILGDRYALCCVHNGREALAALEADGSFAAVVLDLVMPVMDGYEFLRRKGLCPKYENLPVLVITGAGDDRAEARSLELGAWDYTTKPYQTHTVQLRLANIIARSRQSLYRQLAYVSGHDVLTGLLNQQAFLAEMQQTLRLCPGARFTLILIDISRFGLINSLYGATEGDALLCHMARIIAGAAAAFPHALCSRINADVFCLCVPCRDEILTRLLKDLQAGFAAYPAHYYLETVFGVYPIDDTSLDTRVMYRCALLAAATCKNNYQQHVAYYDVQLSQRQRKEQQIANEMESALASGQFVVYLQPKFDLLENRVCGAEALVRWQHPTRGQIPPDEFVPVFERNGFIPLLDRFMWEQVCLLLRRWLDAGIRPDPISVNVSRQNLYNPDLAVYLDSLVRRYRIPPALIEFEITESAYMDGPAHMYEIVNQLHACGFTLLMDDFGSKYSSLNSLKDIPVDILKLDIAFLAPSAHLEKERLILKSMLEMAQRLHLPTIMEGVETEAQKRFLQQAGCRYAQGYYFAKPLPVAEYEALMPPV